MQTKESAIASTRASPYSIDILIVGSVNKIDQAQLQRDTWASHPAVRHFILSTEYDDTNPACNNMNWTNREILDYIKPCRHHSKFWDKLGSHTTFTDYARSKFARAQWLKEKPSPAGWLCAQRRFATSFTELAERYTATQSLPDYLIIADDDTYINIEHIVQMMIHQPKKLEEQGLSQDNSIFPTSDTPIVWAGCRIRMPVSLIQLLVPFGGYGTYFSKGSLKQWTKPLHCNTNTKSNIKKEESFEEGTCNKLLNKANNPYPLNATIAEERYFEDGDSLNRLFYKYAREMDHFCLHSDWFLGYISNFYNISRHTVGGEYWDDRKVDTAENRLHSFMGSDVYKEEHGQCRFGNSVHNVLPCEANSTVCHYMNASSLAAIYSEASKIITDN